MDEKDLKTLLEVLTNCIGNDPEEWESLDSGEWVTLLTKLPHYRHEYSFEVSDEIPFPPEKVNAIEQKCDAYSGWQKITSRDLLELLIQLPGFANKPFSAEAWENISSSSGSFDDISLSHNGWPSLLQAQPGLALYCDRHCGWFTFNGDDWVELLSVQPQFINRCEQYKGWSKFDSRLWGLLLQKQPQFSDKCDSLDAWKSFEPDNWADLLKQQPRFAQKSEENNAWRNFKGGDWVSLLAFRPEFEDRCDKYEGWAKLDVRQWAFLLKSQPHFSEKCNSVGKWLEFDGFDWIELLRDQPSFAAKCEEVDGWGRIAECGRWCELLESCPQFASKCDEYNGWERFDGFDWWRLLRAQRCFIEKSNVWYGWKKIYIYEPDHICESDHCGGIITAWDNFDNTYPAEYWETYGRNGRWGSPYWDALFALFDAIGIEFNKDENGTIFITDESSLWRVDNSYWIYVVMQFPSSSWHFEREPPFIDIFNRRGICRRFSSKDWQLAIGKGDCTFLNEVAPLVDKDFWDALQKCSPTWFEDAEEARKQETDTAEQNKGFSAWSLLLYYKPEYAFACKAKRGWDEFKADDWGHLLGEGSSFLKKVDSKMLDGEFWFPLLTQAPHFCQICDKYNGWFTLTDDNWYSLLLKHPQLADRCHVWVQFDDKQWVELLKQIPALFEVCSQSDGWAKFTKEDWLDLLSERESFVVACEKTGALAKFGWKTKNDAIEEAMETHHIVYDNGPQDVLEVPDWQEESGWNDMYGDADPSDFIEFR